MYHPDGRADEHTDFRGNISKQIWHTCCARLQASIDRDGPAGGGNGSNVTLATTIYNTDPGGRPIHTAVIQILTFNIQHSKFLQLDRSAGC